MVSVVLPAFSIAVRVIIWLAANQDRIRAACYAAQGIAAYETDLYIAVLPSRCIGQWFHRGGNDWRGFVQVDANANIPAVVCIVDGAAGEALGLAFCGYDDRLATTENAAKGIATGKTEGGVAVVPTSCVGWRGDGGGDLWGGLVDADSPEALCHPDGSIQHSENSCDSTPVNNDDTATGQSLAL